MKKILTLPSGRIFKMDFLERIVFVDIVRKVAGKNGRHANFPWTIHYFVKAASSSEYLDALEIDANSENKANADRGALINEWVASLTK